MGVWNVTILVMIFCVSYFPFWVSDRIYREEKCFSVIVVSTFFAWISLEATKEELCALRVEWFQDLHI
jgi:hypothetical protein